MALTLPPFFPDLIWHQVKDRVCPHIANPSIELNNFLGSWQAVRYRFRAAWENAQVFTQVIQQPEPKSENEKYQEDQTLSEIFFFGLSAIESFCFCLYFAGAVTSQSAHFPLTKKPEKIDLKSTVDAFRNAFLADAFTTDLSSLQSDAQFKEWSYIRNVLAHRVSPGRIMYMSNWRKPNPPDWNLPASLPLIPLDAQTAQSRLDWLTKTLNRLINAADQFTQMHFK
jgi:hypothetical protein